VVQSKNLINMKKISLVALGCLAVASVMAQDTQSSDTKDYKPLRTEMARKVRFGVQAGVNLAKFHMSGVPAGQTVDPTMKTSLYGGAFVNIPIGIFRIQPGVIYTGLGSKITGSTTTATNVRGVTVIGGYSQEQDLHYIAVPVMLQLVPGHNGFFIEAGPQIGYLITGRVETQTAGSTTADSYNKSDYDRTDFGVNGGVGYITRVGLGFTARYYSGFTNVYKDNGSTTANGQVARNRAWQFGLIYHFGAAK
jgi:hypothetical protein